jgi:hypothetical protein
MSDWWVITGRVAAAVLIGKALSQGGCLASDPPGGRIAPTVRCPYARRFDMRGPGLCVAVIVTILALSSGAFAEEAKHDATLELTQTSVALVIGYTWGGGTLTFQDRSYPIEIDGLSFLALGVVRAKASAEVFNMKSLDDFNGTYFAGSIEGTVGAGAGATTMRNQNGVVIQLFTTTQGLNLKLAPEGVRLYLK